MAAQMRQGGPAPGRRGWWVKWGVAAALLCVPAIAMRYTGEVNWTASDFVVMGALLFGCCAVYELVSRLSDHWAYRAGAAVAIVTGLLVLWSNLAVGIIGSEDNAYNLAFFGIVASALVGSALVRFRARPAARVLVAVAATQAVASGIGATQDVRGATVSMVFVGLWLLAAALLGTAARARR